MPRRGPIAARPALPIWREVLAEQVEYRELFRCIVERDLMVRYKQTVLGVAWALFMPLLNTAIFSVIFRHVTTITTPVPYPVFAFCGLWVWYFFVSSLRIAVTSLTNNSPLISKVYFPREILPFAAITVSFVDFLISSIVLAALMIYYRIPVGVQLLWLPAVVLVHVAFTAGIALLLSMSNLFYRDIRYLFEILIAVLMFGTSVLYPVDRIPGGAGIILRFNPMSAIVVAYRSVLLLDAPPQPSFGFAAAAAAAILIAGWLWFHRAEFNFAENI